MRAQRSLLGPGLAAMAAAGAVAWSATECAAVIIADEGAARAVVVVADKATVAEKHAAGELADYLSQVTGGRFRATDRYSPTRPCLLVGGDAARYADAGFSAEALGPEELVVRSVGKDVILAGGRPRGTLYAVYTLLEDVVGCRWWTPETSTIPHRPTLKIPALDRRETPEFEFREPYWADALDPDWCVRNRVVGCRSELDAARGGRYAELGGVHSFNRYMPPDPYFAAHPEWFSELDGVRVGDSSQLCLTNEAAAKEFARLVRDDIRGHYPGVTNVWVSQNDWDNYCQCQECRRLAEAEGTPAGPLVLFVNRVAVRVAEEFPDVAINTLAYDWSQKPPRTLRPLPNVVVWLCTTGCSYSVPYADARNRVFREALDGWALVCDRIYIWDYVTNFAAYLCPHPNLHTLGPNMRYFADHQVKGVFSLGAYGGHGAEMSALRAWMTAKLCWDPRRDDRALLREFMEGYYGPAAPDVRAAVEVFHRALAADPQDLYMTQQPTTSRFLNLQTLTAAWRHLQAAREAAGRDEALLRRVELAELPLLYVFLVRWDELQARAGADGLRWPLEEDIRPVYERFVAATEAHGVNQLSESNARDWFPSVRERFAVGLAPAPPGCEGLPRERWADLQDAGFGLHGAGESPPRVEGEVADLLASDGRAARMPGGHDMRALQRELWRVPFVTMAAEQGRRVRCLLSVRCELKGNTGVAFRFGIDGKAQTEVAVADVPDDQYHTYDLGVFDDLRGWLVLWVAPAANGDAVEAVWVDRAWLVAEE